jgi:hypothetical protein
MFQAQFNLSVGESVFVCALNYSILEWNSVLKHTDDVHVQKLWSLHISIKYI